MVKAHRGDEIASGPAPAPAAAALAELLCEHADFGPAPLVPEVSVFQGRVLLELWGAAERLAGRAVPPPFWGYPWPGGISLARTILDRPELVAGRRVLDLGAGGGVSSLAAVIAGAAEVIANDQDPWALVTAQLAAERQGLALATLLGDLAGGDDAGEGARCDVVLCGDLSYERSVAPKIRAFLERAREGGALVLAADAGRAYFDPTGFELLAEYLVPVPHDLEGATERRARVYRLK